MTPPRSAFTARALAFVAVAVALLTVVVPAFSVPGSRPATSSPASTTPSPLSASLIASSPTVPTGGTFGYTAQIRLAEQASYLQSVLEVERPSGQLLFKRTRVANWVKPGIVSFDYERALTDALALPPGAYPVKLNVSASIAGSTVTTEAAATLRVYSAKAEPVRIALIARVTGQPMSAPDGRFAIDPALATGARTAVATIANRVVADPSARVTLAVPPMLLSEWRRLTGGYTLSTGQVVRPSDPVPVAYNDTLADLRAAVQTGRLELVTLGYSDPNLTDLANHGLARDVQPQYDAGISAVFASLELTPSVGTAPAGSCVPPNEVGLLAEKGVRYVVVSSDCVRAGKKDRPTSGAYKVSGEKVTALVVDSAGVNATGSAGVPGVIERAFTRLVKEPKRPIVLLTEIDGDSTTPTDTVGSTLSVLESQPWVTFVNGHDVKPAGSPKVTLLGGHSTPRSPKGFWKTVAQARSYADGYYAALGPSDPEATTAAARSLVAEGSVWSHPGTTWQYADRGLEFANTSLAITRPVLDAVHVKLEPITLSGVSGKIPITIVNDSDKTLNVVVKIGASGGLRVDGPRAIPTVLGPQETFLEVPVDLQASLGGKLTVEVTADGMTLERRTVTVRASYLDRLALGGLAILMIGGLLVVIVRRTRRAEASDRVAERQARYTDDDDGDVKPSSR